MLQSTVIHFLCVSTLMFLSPTSIQNFCLWSSYYPLSEPSLCQVFLLKKMAGVFVCIDFPRLSLPLFLVDLPLSAMSNITCTRRSKCFTSEQSVWVLVQSSVPLKHKTAISCHLDNYSLIDHGAAVRGWIPGHAGYFLHTELHTLFSLLPQ